MELELENLDINDDPLELDCGDEAEDLTKKLLDEQGKNNWFRCFVVSCLFYEASQVQRNEIKQL